MRPTELTEDIAKAIAQNMVQGLTFNDSCLLAGLAVGNGLRYKEQGEAELTWMIEHDASDPRPEYAVYAIFADLVSRAIPLRKQTLLTDLKRKGARSWMADAWLLERLHPDEFGRSDRLQLQGDSNKPLGPQIIVMLPDNSRGDVTR